MSRGSGTFTQSEIKAALKAAMAIGMEIGRVEIDKEGKITIYAMRSGHTGVPQGNEWDEVFDGTPTA